MSRGRIRGSREQVRIGNGLGKTIQSSSLGLGRAAEPRARNAHDGLLIVHDLNDALTALHAQRDLRVLLEKRVGWKLLRDTADKVGEINDVLKGLFEML